MRNTVMKDKGGIAKADAYGVSIYELRKVAKRPGVDHDLALWIDVENNHSVQRSERVAGVCHRTC